MDGDGENLREKTEFQKYRIILIFGLRGKLANLLLGLDVDHGGDSTSMPTEEEPLILGITGHTDCRILVG